MLQPVEGGVRWRTGLGVPDPLSSDHSSFPQAVMHTWIPAGTFTVPSAASPWLFKAVSLQKQACRMLGGFLSRREAQEGWPALPLV